MSQFLQVFCSFQNSYPQIHCSGNLYLNQTKINNSCAKQNMFCTRIKCVGTRILNEVLFNTNVSNLSIFISEDFSLWRYLVPQ